MQSLEGASRAADVSKPLSGGESAMKRMMFVAVWRRCRTGAARPDRSGNDRSCRVGGAGERPCGCRGGQVGRQPASASRSARGHQRDGVLGSVRVAGPAPVQRSLHERRKPASRGTEPGVLLQGGKRRSGRRSWCRSPRRPGTRKLPEFGSGNYGLVGNDQASARPHVTIAVPFATTETLKLPSKPTPTGAWIMNAGTSGAHLMVPGH